jgi:hypothetical protein
VRQGQQTVLFCAGATKAGTSWLWDYLSSHPETHLRSIKELQFFGRLENGGLVHLARRLGKEIETLETELATGKPKWPTWIARQIADRRELQGVARSGAEARYLRYLTEGAGDKRLVADMTPEYGLLPITRMQAMTGLLPDVRWIFLMRDPVARLWSHVRMLTRRTKCPASDFARIAAAKFEDVLAGKAEDVTLRSDYAAIHDRLAKAIAPERRLVMFYERLMTVEGVAEVTEFLGLSAHSAKFEKRVHEGVASPMPADLHSRAHEWLAPQYAFVAKTWGLPPEWEAHPELKNELA